MGTKCNPAMFNLRYQFGKGNTYNIMGISIFSNSYNKHESELTFKVGTYYVYDIFYYIYAPPKGDEGLLEFISYRFLSLYVIFIDT